MNARELSAQVIDSQSVLWALVTFIVCGLASLYFAATPQREVPFTRLLPRSESVSPERSS